MRYERIEHPTKTQGPASGDISSHMSPVEEHPRIRMLASDNTREDDEDDRGAVVA